DDRRTSGSAASLIGLEAARSGAEVDRAASALRLAHALVLGWGGIPVIWSGDELGQPNDPLWANEPGHGEDNRWAHRPRLDWARAEERHDRGTVAGRVFGDLVELVGARGRLVHLHGSVETTVGPVDDPGVLVTVREHPVGRFVGVYNVTPEPRPWPGWRVGDLGVADARDEITGEALPWGDDGNVWLPPYAVLWLTTSRH
ncbi:MAG TPA: alpha-amylase, partial [Ornithinibacter sp.]|nr:alpha-amylase [Ornithinibacter sp.]